MLPTILSQIDAAPLVKAWGPWGIIIAAIGLLIWKWLIPLANKVIERSQARNDKLIEMIAANLLEAQKNREVEQRNREIERDKFLAVVDGSLKTNVQVLSTLAKAVDESLRRTREPS